MRTRPAPALVIAACLAACAPPANAERENDDSAITGGGSIELEHQRERTRFSDDRPATRAGETATTVQLEFEVTTRSESGVHIVLEVDTDDEPPPVVDEAYLFMARDAFAASAGRLYVPFGRFDSVFGTDALTEFGEIRARSLLLGFDPGDLLSVGLFVIDGRIDAGSAPDIDYGVSLELAAADESWRVGAGYVSDLAEARDPPFELEGRRTGKRVAGWNLFAGMSFGDFELFFETVAAANRFEDPDPAWDEPAASTLELIYRPHDKLDLALRTESSREIEDAPKRRYGVTARWYPSEYLTIGADLLAGRFAPARSTGDDGETPTRVREFLFQAVLEF